MDKKYFVVELVSFNNGDKDSYAVYPYNTRDEAVQVYHQKISTNMKWAIVATSTVVVLDMSGNKIMSDFYMRRVEEAVEEA